MLIWILLVTFLAYKITTLFATKYNILIPNTIIGLLLGVLSATYFYVILLIPYELGIKFDPIKNKVAQSAFKNTEDFQLEIAQFISEFFHYPGAHIIGGIYKFKDTPTLSINAPNEDLEANTLKNLSKDESVKKISIHNKKAFLVPIQLGNTPLGYMILFTKGFTFPFIKDLLSDFENYYLDDQLMHVLNQTNK